MKISSSNSEFGNDLSHWFSLSYFAVLISIGQTNPLHCQLSLFRRWTNGLYYNCTIGQICCFSDQEILYLIGKNSWCKENKDVAWWFYSICWYWKNSISFRKNWTHQPVYVMLFCICFYFGKGN